MKSGLRWYDGFFVLLFFYLLVLQIQAIWPFTVDDMYISLRYAKNWVSGDGLLWNVGSPPVEGYSNFFFVVLAACSLLVNADPVLTLKLAGFAGLICLCIFLYLLSRFWFTPRVSLIPCIVALLYKGQIIWAVSGLETAFYQALICGAVYFIFRGMGYAPCCDVRGTIRLFSLFIAGVLLAWAGMTRPEAPALVLLFFLLMWWDRPQNMREQYQRGMVCFSAPVILIYLPYFFWRWSYYGYLFPNSVYCKGFNEVFLYNLDWDYLKLIAPFVVLSIPAFCKAWDKRYFFLWLPSLVYLILLRDANPVVAFDNRLFLPAFVLLIPLALRGLEQLVLPLLNEKSAIKSGLFYVLFAFILVLFIPMMSVGQYRYFTENPVRGEQLRYSVVQWLNTHSRTNDRVVLGDSGLIPYLSDLHFIDSFCLNNLAMTHYSVKQRYKKWCQHLMIEQPEIIILTSLIKNGQVFYEPGDECLKTALSSHSGYTMRQSFTAINPDSKYRYELFTNF
ncbi:hypothetical protein [Legionella worsleiensis]|uniref:LphB n=1 Tax=Legionella worsleiensis TaxID=45076 RepID=A0A0W1A968_9GAMM|nr:hypothetical protein [Legionella worsleiensis]KTD77873.1 LphB [Legionella worsleiensis]STY33118.1 LphB [Legionella worsleiensis]